MVMTKSLIIHIAVYVIMAILALIILFLVIRLIAQMIFIRECPRCKKSVSLVKTKMCPKCNYDFAQDSDPKYIITVIVLFFVFAALTAFDVYSFRNHMKAYQTENPYASVSNISKEGSGQNGTQTKKEANSTQTASKK